MTASSVLYSSNIGRSSTRGCWAMTSNTASSDDPSSSLAPTACASCRPPHQSTGDAGVATQHTQGTHTQLSSAPSDAVAMRGARTRRIPRRTALRIHWFAGRPRQRRNLCRFAGVGGDSKYRRTSKATPSSCRSRNASRDLEHPAVVCIRCAREVSLFTRTRQTSITARARWTLNTLLYLSHTHAHTKPRDVHPDTDTVATHGLAQALHAHRSVRAAAPAAHVRTAPTPTHAHAPHTYARNPHPHSHTWIVIQRTNR